MKFYVSHVKSPITWTFSGLEESGVFFIIPIDVCAWLVTISSPSPKSKAEVILENKYVSGAYFFV